MADSPSVQELLRVAEGATSSLIVIQNIPDPDAIASAEALKHILMEALGIESTIAFEGLVGRAENRGLLRYLGIELAQINKLRLDTFDLISTVDTQPQFSNNPLPDNVKCNIVIDHHDSDVTPSADYVDIRSRYGATSTIMTEYLRASEAPVDVRLATALLYGIKSDTQDLGRESTLVDVQAYLFLYPRANKFALAQIEHEGAPRDYFVALHKALDGCRQFGTALVVNVQEVKIPEVIAEIADVLMRFDQGEYVLCYGVCRKQIIISLRTRKVRGNANALMREIIRGIGSGGGHETFAGGQVPLDEQNLDEVARILEQRFLEALTLTGAKPVKLIAPHSTAS